MRKPNLTSMTRRVLLGRSSVGLGGFAILNRDLNAADFSSNSLLHLLGLKHERLTFRDQGRGFRLTEVAGRVVEKLLA